MTPQASGRRPTIRAVADRAGVSKSLVSLVLNDSPKVSEPSRQAVLEAIEELGYTPNAQARSLAAERTHSVALILSDMRNCWFVDAIDGANLALAAAGLRLLIADQRLDLRGGETAVQGFAEMGVDGAILMGPVARTPLLDSLVRLVPSVMVLGHRSWPGAAVDGFIPDYARGIGLVVEHLRSLGHQRIAHIAVAGEEAGEAKQMAYETAMREAGLEEHTQIAVAAEGEDGGFRAAVALLARPKRPTAIVAYDDVTAAGALSAAKDLKIANPAACSIAGYGNMGISRSRALSLTTVDQATPALGRQAVATLIQRMRAPLREPDVTLIEPTLVVRLSTGPVPQS